MTRNFSTNWNGKLLLKCFCTIRPHEAANATGNTHLITFGTGQRTEIGTAKIVAVKQVRFENLTEHQAYIDTGHNIHYLRTLLRKFYKKEAETLTYDFIIYEWQTINEAALLKLAADHLKKTFTVEEAKIQKLNLFDQIYSATG